MAEYKNIFSPKTLTGLKGQSKDTLSKTLKGRQPSQMQYDAVRLVNKLESIESDYKDELEELAVQIAKEVYPVIDYAGIGIDAKLGKDTKLGQPYKTDPELLKKHDIIIHARGLVFPILMHEIAKGLYELISKQAYHSKVSPEKRRIINSITQGGAVQGAFSHYVYKDYLDSISPELSKDYTQVMDDVFGGYHDEASIAKLLQAIDRYGDQLEGVGRVNVTFPKRTEPGSEEAKQVTKQVDTYKNELDDIRFGRYIYNSITKIWVDSEFDDPRVRDLFLAELYKVEDYDEFHSFVENAINDELTNEQKKWAFYTMRDINDDLKKDDTGLEDLDEIKRMQKLAGVKVDEIHINKPGIRLTYDDIKKFPVIDLKIGKYDVAKGRVGKQTSFYSKNVSTPTKNRVLAVFNKLGIKPEKTWVAWIKYTRPDGTIGIDSLKSTFVLSHYGDEPIIIAQTQTSSPMSGQMYIYSKYFKSGKSLRLPDGTGGNIDDSTLFADKNATKEQILQALKISKDTDQPQSVLPKTSDDLKKDDTGLEDLDEIKRMQKLAGVKVDEIHINKPLKTIFKVTNKSYIDVDADIIIDLLYKDSEMGGRSSYFSDTLQNVVRKLNKDINNLYSHTYEFDGLDSYIDGDLGDILENHLTKDNVLTLVNYYNTGNDQKLLEYILEISNQEDTLHIEDNGIINDDNGEFISLTDIKKEIEKILLPFVTLYNQLGIDKFTIGYGDYIGEDYLIEANEDGIEYTENLWSKDFSDTLSEFTTTGNIKINTKEYNQNPDVF